MCRRIALPLVLLASLAAGARAQERNLDIERLRPAPDRYGFLGLPGTRTPGPWMWNVSLWAGYTLEPLTFTRLETGDRLPIVRHRASADVIVQLGVLDRIALVLDVPFVVWQDTDARPLDDGAPLSTVAIRDPYAAARVRILGEGSTGEHGGQEGPGLAAQLAVTLPFGLEHTFAGEGAPQIEAAVLGDFRFLSFGLGALVGYRHRFARPRIAGVGFAHELFFGAALESPVFVLENTSAVFETRVVTALDDEAFRGESTAVEGDVGVRWAEGDLMMLWTVGTGFSGGVGTPAFRGAYALEWAPRTRDADGDGIRDDLERPECVRLPEDEDGFEDEDGCPDPDNDGDLVPDEDDRCPNEAAEFGRDADDDGCNDGPADRDGDGIADDADACADEAEDRDGHEDADGCPDPDDDGDGIGDADDRCPREAEDRDGHEDEDGCPDPDDDGDGVLDGDDRCPREAEDRDGHEDGDGCPDPDDDRDGVLDADDRCPDAREDIDGVDDGDGCPERGGRSLWTPFGEGELPSLRARVRFDAAGAVARASVGAIDQLARHLIARWGARPWRVAIAEGPEGRAAALGEALAGRSVPSDRFEVVVDPALTGTTIELRAPAGP